jgi:hypothetical protein
VRQTAAMVVSVKVSVCPFRAHSRFNSPASLAASQAIGTYASWRIRGVQPDIHFGHIDGAAGERVLLENQALHEIRPPAPVV